MTRIYPDMKKLVCDVTAVGGYVNNGCIVKNNKIIPTDAPEFFADIDSRGADFVGYAEATGQLVACAHGEVYFIDKDGVYHSAEKTLAARQPFIAEYSGDEMRSYVIGDNSCMEITPEKIAELPFNYGIFGGVFKNNRIFARDSEDEYKIRWSGPDGCDDWEDGLMRAGWVRVNGSKGKILKLVVYNDRVVVLCEHGIALLTAYGTTENFKLGYIDGETRHIWGCTAAVAADKLVFFADGGLFGFDGGKVEKIELGEKYGMSNPTSACGLGDWYYVCGYCQSLKKNGVLCVNVAENSAYFADVDATYVFAHEQVYCFAKGKAYVFASGEYKFVSGNIDFGSKKRKVLESLYLNCEKKVDLEISNGFKTRILRGVNGNVRVNMGGKEFTIAVKGGASIEEFKAYAEAVDEV